MGSAVLASAHLLLKIIRPREKSLVGDLDRADIPFPCHRRRVVDNIEMFRALAG